jgi:hypothetical protein
VCDTNHTGEKKEMHKTFWWENPKGKRQLVSLWPRWEDNIKMDLKN